MNRLVTRATALAAVSAGFLVLVSPLAVAQSLQRSTAIASSDILSQISMFSYRERRKSDLLLRPTPVLSSGQGKVEVEYRDGNAEISAEVWRLPSPATLGPYTTYVLWTLTPDGRFRNEGVLADAASDRGSLETRHGAPQFALIVTAEPHFAVSAPSTMVVLYNVADDVKGEESKVTTLTERADYSGLAAIEIDARARPADIVQAQYSLAIARAAGAEEYANHIYEAALEKFAAAQAAWKSRRSSDRRQALAYAREAVIAGEDARRAAMVASVEAVARAEAEAAAAAAAAAERERAERAAAEERERAARAAAEAARAAEIAREEAARVAAAEAEARATAAARADLLRRLNAVLPTRVTDRGLVSEIGGVQFATGTAYLNGQARENLAKFSGIVASYPDLRFVVEGHTDSVGSDATNMELSYRRAISVRDYLIGQSVLASSIDVEGFGSSRPIADNATTSGRARNRRVEIVISGGLLMAQSR